MSPFDPGNNSTIVQANAVASAGGLLPETATTVVLTNTSPTATAYFTYQPGQAAATAIVPSAGVLGSMPILPNQQIRITVNSGPKTYATIASASDGNLLITPGDGN